MTYATFIISTGRCGTQWLAATLSSVYSDLITVEHEPLHNRYEPRKALSLCSSPDTFAKLPAAVIAHCDKIERQLEERPYIECGHPCWSSIPCLVHRFRERVRIIHLTRHPVPTSCSWMTHGAFQPQFLPQIPVKTLLSPFDAGVKFPEYQPAWETMTQFEKCLYFWIEVNSYAMDLQTRLNVPWLQIRSEDLFDGDGLERTLEFLNLPRREEIMSRKSEVIDKHRYASPFWEDWRVINNHPAAIEVMRKLGYDLADIDETALRERYTGVTM